MWNKKTELSFKMQRRCTCKGYLLSSLATCQTTTELLSRNQYVCTNRCYQPNYTTKGRLEKELQMSCAERAVNRPKVCGTYWRGVGHSFLAWHNAVLKSCSSRCWRTWNLFQKCLHGFQRPNWQIVTWQCECAGIMEWNGLCRQDRQHWRLGLQNRRQNWIVDKEQK